MFSLYLEVVEIIVEESGLNVTGLLRNVFMCDEQLKDIQVGIEAMVAKVLELTKEAALV